MKSIVTLLIIIHIVTMSSIFYLFAKIIHANIIKLKIIKLSQGLIIIIFSKIINNKKGGIIWPARKSQVQN